MKRRHLRNTRAQDAIPQVPRDRGRRRWHVAMVAGLGLTISAGASCQDVTDGPSNMTAPQVRAPVTVQRMAVGTRLLAPPPAAAGPDAPKPRIVCQFECSAYVPRLVTARIAFPEQATRAPSTLRVDVAISPLALRSGNYGSVPLRAVTEVQVRPETGIDVERVRALAAPAYFDRVVDHTVVARDPVLEPQRLQQLQRTRSLASAPPELRAAMDRDARAGGIEQMRAVAQGVELRRAVPHRTLVVEGMQPGMTYEVRLVQEGARSAEGVEQNVCHIPVCPADFVDQ